MPKRFTDTDKWKKPFIRGLQAPYKLLWFYIIDECDHAGIWQVDLEVAQIKIGEKISLDHALKNFAEKIIVFSNGEKWFIPDFIDFQYGVLNPANRAHNSVIQILNKYQLLNKNKPLTSPLQGAMDMDMDKDMDKVIECITENWKNYFIKKCDKQRHLIGKEEKKQITDLANILSPADCANEETIKVRTEDYLNTVYGGTVGVFDIETPLPDVTIESARLVQSANGGDFSDSYITNQWKAFLSKRNNDTAENQSKYKSIQDLTSHFLNWLPKQRNTVINGTYKPNTKPGGKSAGAAILVEMLRNDITGGTNPR